ncbi:ribonuclease [Neisseria gonorrhoeae]|uniref:Ribonuclease n=1 Tax=Neisseria gonorrhoeae TaxID=485 RepID=A0AAX2TQ34_NEIGO|nr:ribonuclease [Neisseria gonorrhoeae]
MMGILFLIKFLTMPSEGTSAGPPGQKIRSKKKHAAEKNRVTCFSGKCLYPESSVF